MCAVSNWNVGPMTAPLQRQTKTYNVIHVLYVHVYICTVETISYVILRDRGVREPTTAHWKSSLNSPSFVERNDICRVTMHYRDAMHMHTYAHNTCMYMYMYILSSSHTCMACRAPGSKTPLDGEKVKKGPKCEFCGSKLYSATMSPLFSRMTCDRSAHNI